MPHGTFLPGNVANKKLAEDFKMSNIHMVMMDKDMDSKIKRGMMEQIDEVKCRRFLYIVYKRLVLCLLKLFIKNQDQRRQKCYAA